MDRRIIAQLLDSMDSLNHRNRAGLLDQRGIGDSDGSDAVSARKDIALDQDEKEDQSGGTDGAGHVVLIAITSR